MQITKAKVTPVEIKLAQPIQISHAARIDHITAVFVRIETVQGVCAWGCSVVIPEITDENVESVIDACQDCAAMLPDLHPTNIEYSLAQLAPIVENVPSALCAYDLAFNDLQSWAAGMPLYRLLGGYRDRIQTSVTVPISSVKESVELAQDRARLGFRMLKIKGGLDPEEDVMRVRAINRVLPDHILRLDPDGGYTVEQALDVARALDGKIEMLEQPTPGDDLSGLKHVTNQSPVPILADQSVRGPGSALHLASQRCADGLSVKISTCGGLRCAQQVDAITRAAGIATMISCNIEPALLISAGLSIALSSPNIRYADLDGHLDLLNDPSQPGFALEDGWLIASETPGIGCTVNLN